MTICDHKNAVPGTTGPIEGPESGIHDWEGRGLGSVGRESPVFTIRRLLDDLGESSDQFETMITSLLSMYLCRKQRHPWKILMGLMERNIIIHVLCRTNGNQRDAGRILGLKSSTLNAKIKKYRIRVVKRIDYRSLPEDPPADECQRGAP